jgi:hypothetical protein
VCHSFGPKRYFDNHVNNQLSEFNNAYVGVMVNKAVMYVRISLQSCSHVVDSVDKKVVQEMDNSGFNYLWHYNYDQTFDKLQCDEETVSKKCLKFVKKWKKGGVHHKATWYFRGRSYYIPSDGKFESKKMHDILSDSGSLTGMAARKVICFGPVLPEVGKEEEWFYKFRVRICWVYHLSFTGRKSQCPGFCCMKEFKKEFDRGKKSVA